jgi:hypothetical protein
METITCACPHCKNQTETYYDEYLHDWYPTDEERWAEIDGAWRCISCWGELPVPDGYGGLEYICECEYDRRRKAQQRLC